MRYCVATHIIVNVQLADFGLSCKTLANSSIMGLIMRHGPHQGAQKSTRTGRAVQDFLLKIIVGQCDVFLIWPPKHGCKGI